MTPARKDPWGQWWLHRYIGWRLRGQFHSFGVWGLGGLAAVAPDRPRLLFCSHTSWWDGFLLVPVFEKLDLDYYVMMEEKNLRKFPFFRRAGAFGVDLETARGRAEGLLHGRDLLRQAGAARRTLVLFPQGRLVRPFEEDPAFAGGLDLLARGLAGGVAVPAALELTFGPYPDPQAWLELGAPQAGGPGPAGRWEALWRETRARLRQRLAAGATEPEQWLVPPRKFFLGRT